MPAGPCAPAHLASPPATTAIVVAEVAWLWVAGSHARRAARQPFWPTTDGGHQAAEIR